MRSEIKIGKRLQLCRDHLKPRKSQTEVAKDLGITRGHLIKLENDERQPSYDLLVEIACYYNTTTDYLLGKEKQPLPERGAEILDYLRGMSPRARVALLTIAKGINELDQDFQAIARATNTNAALGGLDEMQQLKFILPGLASRLGSYEAALDYITSIVLAESASSEEVNESN